MATDSTSDTLTRWAPRPAVAALVRACALIAPIAASVVFVHVASRIVGPPSYDATFEQFEELIGIDRLTRRMLPLAALLKLALVFPDEAPSRFRTALRAGTTADLEGRLRPGHFRSVATVVSRLFGLVRPQWAFFGE